MFGDYGSRRAHSPAVLALAIILACIGLCTLAGPMVSPKVPSQPFEGMVGEWPRMDTLLQCIKGCLPKSSDISLLYLQSEGETTGVLRSVSAVLFANLRGEGREDVIVGFLAPSPDPGMGEQVAIAWIVFQEGRRIRPKRIWQSGYFGSYFCPPYYLSVFDINGDGRLEIVANRSGDPAFKGDHIEVFQWNDEASTVTSLIFATRAKDMDGDGVPEILDASLFQLSFRGGPGGIQIRDPNFEFYRVYKWTGEAYEDVSAKFPQVYQRLLANYEKRLKQPIHPSYEGRVRVILAHCYAILGDRENVEKERHKLLDLSADRPDWRSDWLNDLPRDVPEK